MICITHDLSGFAACVVRGAHTADCVSGTCEGCKPREARFGMLCSACWWRLEEAEAAFQPFFAHLGGLRSAVTSDSGSAGFGPRLPFSPLQLDMDAIMRARKRGHPRLDMWVSTPGGAESALWFTRYMKHAEHHEWSEKSHPVPKTKCPKCAKRTLVWNPAQWQGDDVRVGCIDPTCAWVARQDRFEIIADIEARAEKGKPPLGEFEAWCVEFRADPERGRGLWPSRPEIEAEFGAEWWIHA